MQVAATVGANASQAEKTLSHYNGNDTGKRPKKNCWGCGGDHSWMHKGKVVCPRGTDPTIIKTAAEKYAAYKELMAAKRGACRRGRGKSVDFKDLDAKSQKKMRETVLAMSADTSSVTSNSTLTTSVSSVSAAGTTPKGSS